MIVGLTGGIGSGKSVVASFFKELKVPVYIADQRAKTAMENNEIIRKEIVENFGSKSYQGTKPNRGYLAEIVFNQPEKLEVLNGIIHPVVRRDFKMWYAAQKAVYVIKEVAILFESGGAKECDAIITVTAPEEVRISRVIQRDQTTRSEVKARMRNQWTDAQRIKKSTYVIENTDLDVTRENVYAIHQHILKKSI